MNDENREPGRIPRTIDCELTHDLGKFDLFQKLSFEARRWLDQELQVRCDALQ